MPNHLASLRWQLSSQSLLLPWKMKGLRPSAIHLLKLTKEFGRDRLRQAVEIALETGCTDAAAVQHLMHARDLDRPACDAMDIGSLERYQRPLPVINEYDQLLSMGAR